MPQFTIPQAIEHAEQLRSRGDFAQAENLYREILKVTPNNPFILNRIGICLGEAKKFDDARQMFETAIAIDPRFADAWANLSLAKERAEDLEGAIAARLRAIEINGDNADAHHRLGTCYGKKGDYTSAIRHLHKSLELNPAAFAVYHDLQLALVRDNQIDAAEQLAFEQMQRFKTVNAESFRPLADSLKSIGQFQRATNLWKKAVETDPLCHEALGELAMCLITLGDYAAGWEMYEVRWKCGTFAENARLDPSRQWGKPPIGKPDVNGKTILLYSEQGIGDTIQFVRYASLLEQRGARVIVECRWPLKSLLESCAGVRLVYASGTPLPAYDWHIPMLSLPHVFETSPDSIPADIPYLKSDPVRRQRWAQRIDAIAPNRAQLRVGLTWAGNPKHKNDARRSLHPDLLSPLAEIENVIIFSLQKSNEGEKSRRASCSSRLDRFHNLTK